MRKLNKFSKSNKKRKIIVIGAFLLVGLILVGVSYAVYQKEDEVRFINAKVGEFETSSSDIELAMTLDGEDIDTPPEKGYYNVTVECDYADGKWNMKEWGADIRNIKSNRVKCNVTFEALDVLAAKVEIGDYIKMTPTSTSYTIPISLTGATTDQTINPSELNLWRVIRKNEDGTVEVVSEYVSSNDILFFRQTGYMRYVGSLNTIAAQYTNSRYVQSTRHMGYNNQIENCTTPLTHSNYTTCPDDTGYERDANLVQTAVGTLIGKKSNGIASVYWLASRRIRVAEGLGTYYVNRYVTADGVPQASNWTIFYSNDDVLQIAERKHAIRPILTLKSNVKIANGDGESVKAAYSFE